MATESIHPKIRKRVARMDDGPWSSNRCLGTCGIGSIGAKRIASSCFQAEVLGVVRRTNPSRSSPTDGGKSGNATWAVMVWKTGTEEYLVIPKIELGNVILLPQPLRGELHGPDEVSSQIHDKTTTPPHNYMATYFWLEKEYGANAVVHFGTHGSEFALPENHLDYRVMTGQYSHGSMPNFNPWIIENMVESSPVKRRVYGTLISHLPPPIVDAGLSDDLENLHEMLDKWSIIEPGALKDGFQREISKLVRQARLDIDLKLEPSNDLFSASNLQSSASIYTISKKRPRPLTCTSLASLREKIFWYHTLFKFFAGLFFMPSPT